jgi:hypothetical protein
MLVGVERTISHQLVKAFDFPENVFAAIIADLQQVHGVGYKFAIAISDFDVDSATDRQIGLSQKENIRI